MKTRPLGNSGLNASIFGLGTWVTGGGGAWGTEPDDRESIRAIQASLDAGVNLIDTAPSARREEQAVENASAGHLQLDVEDIGRLRRDIEALGEPQRKEAELSE